jgi:phosphatidylethanolamine/phosphatidyl-N-methylethanolamine N-methyltransferase
MYHPSRTVNPLGDRLLFVKEFVRHPKQVASVVPSSRFVLRRIVEAAQVNQASTVVELGAGTGGTTRALLDAMRPEARLLSIEINPRFHAHLRRTDDQRLLAHLGTADQLEETLAGYGLKQPEAIISGIPFSAMDQALGSRILETIASQLGVGGRFVAYQISTRVVELARPFFPSPHVEVVYLNVPPLRIFRWTKPACIQVPHQA